jgi:large subunit ribosomal protein L18
MKNAKLISHERRKARIKGKLKYDKPRLIVFKSLISNYLQLVDDQKGKTLVSTSDLKVKKGTKMEKAKQVGIELAKKAKELKIEEVIFDRNGYKYHGRIKAMADGAREGGLKF